MGLKAKIGRLDGANEELREQLRKSRLDEERSLSALQRAQVKLQQLQAELATFKEDQAGTPEASQALPQVSMIPPLLLIIDFHTVLGIFRNVNLSINGKINKLVRGFVTKSGFILTQSLPNMVCSWLLNHQ